MLMTPEHKAALMAGAARYRDKKRQEADYWARDYQEWQIREAKKMFTTAAQFDAMQARISELEQRLCSYEVA